MKMSTIYLLHILLCSDSEQSVLIPACHSLGVCFRSGRQKKKGSRRADHPDISLSLVSRTRTATTRVLIVRAAWAAKPLNAKMSGSYFLVKTLDSRCISVSFLSFVCIKSRHICSCGGCISTLIYTHQVFLFSTMSTSLTCFHASGVLFTLIIIMRSASVNCRL